MRPKRQKPGNEKAPLPPIKSFLLPSKEEIRWVPSELMLTNQWALYDPEGTLVRHVMYFEYSIINALMEKIVSAQAQNSVKPPVSIS